MVQVEDGVKNPRDEMHRFIKNNPGAHLRKIKKSLGYSIGTTQYHIKNLEKEGLITSKKNGFFKNYFAKNTNQQHELLMSILNLESPRKIILYILENEPCSHKKIAEGIGLSSATVSWHMKKLLEMKFLELRFEGKFSIYRIRNREELLPLLTKYSHSTWNEMMNNMTDLFASFQD